ncbi:MAG: hypothetical protein GQ570_01360 [Helicobacteraceae bacterium]|nr:hypothetical protein [Helicobacteraceae bacterium]
MSVEQFLYLLISLAIIAFLIKNVTPKKQVQTKEQKRAEILSNYKNELESALEECENENRVAIKSKLLKKFSQELAFNIFFDKSEIREILLELSKHK